MPSWYVHIQAAAETLERLNAGVPAGSPLTAAEATQLHTAGHDHRNYLAAGALGPDLFFLLPDFKGDLGTTLLKLVRFALRRVEARRRVLTPPDVSLDTYRVYVELLKEYCIKAAEIRQ